MNFISVSTQLKKSSREKKIPMQKSIFIHGLKRCKNNGSLNSELCFAMAQPYLWHSFFDIVYGICVCVYVTSKFDYIYSLLGFKLSTPSPESLWACFSSLNLSQAALHSTLLPFEPYDTMWCSMLAKQSHCYFARMCLMTAHRWHSFIHLEYHWLFQLIRFNRYKVEFMHCVCFE